MSGWGGGRGDHGRERGRREGDEGRVSASLLSPLQPREQRTWEGSCALGASPGCPSARVMSWTRPSVHASLTSPPY